MSAIAIAEPIQDVEHDATRHQATSVTAAVVAAAYGMADVTVERRLRDKISIAGTAGYTFLVSEDTDSSRLMKVGVQGRYYLTEGLHIGVQSTAESETFEINGDPGSGRALSAGGLVGYKWVSDAGLTLESQLGYEAYVVSGTIEAETPMEFSGSDHDAFLRMNAGWSF